MKAIILAAGMGKRLAQKTEGLPKSMLRIGNSSIIEHQINSCLELGIEDFIIVVGYKKELLGNHILKFLDADRVRFIENNIYDQTNTLYSLWLAREHFDSDFIYFNADVLFNSRLLEKISKPSSRSQLLLETKSCGLEEVKMIVDDDFRILEIGKKIPVEQCAGEFIGIAKFNREILGDFRNCLQQGIDRKQHDNYFEYAVNLLAKRVELEAVPTDGLSCIEIDFPEDLDRAREMFG